MMISEDDARTTLELSDRYVIEPAFAFWTRDHLDGTGAKPVPDGFSYRSDTNTQWLDAAEMRRLLAESAE